MGRVITLLFTSVLAIMLKYEMLSFLSDNYNQYGSANSSQTLPRKFTNIYYSPGSYPNIGQRTYINQGIHIE